jgi:hypothetical protein
VRPPLKVLDEAVTLSKELHAKGDPVFFKWYRRTRGDAGLKQGDFQPRISATGIRFWFKKDADFEKLKEVVMDHGLGVVRIGANTHEITFQERMKEVTSSYGAEGVLVSVQKRSIEVVDSDWVGTAGLVEDIGRRVFGANTDAVSNQR